MELSLNSQEAGGVCRNSEAECVSLCQLAKLHADQVRLVMVLGSGNVRDDSLCGEVSCNGTDARD